VPTLRITLSPAPIVPPPPTAVPGAGACAEFSGLVRGEEDGAPIRGLVYEAYQPMAETVLRRQLEALIEEHGLLAAEVTHRTGPVLVGETAIHVALWARHRAPAFAALSAFMDRLKQDVPIWKTEVLR
jgi:molybdopterin synthase catalytic subunit